MDHEEAQEFIAPADGGWHYTIMRDWIAVCPEINATSARLYWIIRSVMHEKGEKQRRLSIDQLCYLLPGINGKPTSETRVKDALRELESVGLLSNPDGDVVRRWVTDPKTGKQRKENFRRWQIHDYPAKSYDGWRSAISKLDDYTPDWRDRVTEGRKNDSQSKSKAVTSNNSKKTQVSTEGRKSAPTRRKSAQTGRKSGDSKPPTSANEGPKESLQISSSTNQAATSPEPMPSSVAEVPEVVAPAGAGWMAPTQRTDEATLEPAERLLRSLRMPHGPAYRPNHSAIEDIEVALRSLSEETVITELTNDLAGAQVPARALTVRIKELAARAADMGTQKRSQPRMPQWCGQCVERTRHYLDGRRCACHPANAAC